MPYFVILAFLYVWDGTGMPDLTGATVVERGDRCRCEIVEVDDGVQYLVYRDEAGIQLVYQVREGTYQRPLNPNEHIFRWARPATDHQTLKSTMKGGD